MPDRAGLPTPPTPFIGRVADLEEVGELLCSTAASVTTLTGPAGVGKTRLAIEAARRAVPVFPGGVVFVALADVRDPAAVPSALLRALGHDDIGHGPALDVAIELLADHGMLLLLDNFEQVADAAGAVAELARRAPATRVLVTSRRPLGIDAERTFAVAPLAVPDAVDLSAADALRSDAVALLTSRLDAMGVRHRVSEESILLLVSICARLDGLPLALELAAARCRSLSLDAVLDALERSLPVLTRGGRDHPPRQQTMAAAVRWSYELLGTDVAAVFRRLGVCIGGADLAAVRAVAGDLGLDDVALLDAVDDLVQHSLVEHIDDAAGGARYRMLEVIREFAVDELARAHEDQPARRRHAAHFLAVAERAGEMLSGREQASALDDLSRERGNLTAAVRWAIDDGEVDVALRLCLALRFLWYVRGSIAEGRGLFTAALQLPGAPPSLRARALVEATALARHHGDVESALSLVRDALAIARRGDDVELLAWAQLHHGFVLHLLGAYGEAREALEESRAICESVGDRLGVARASHHLGLVAYFGDGDVETSWDLQHHALQLFGELGNERHAATVLIGMCELARVRGDVAVARALLSDALAHVARLRDTPLLVHALQYAAAIAADSGHLNRAVRLLGAADGLERTSGAPPWPAVAAVRCQWLPNAERRLGAPRVAALRAAGSRLSQDDATALAIATDDGVTDPLTRREHEIAALVAEGLTNRAIAARLFLSERTVDGHVARILDRLGFTSRAQIAAWFAGGRTGS